MKWIDLTLPTPEENLALDEALLDLAESGQGGEMLRFWEPKDPFVVLGYSNRWQTEADPKACAQRGIPILRRCSGGGTILQGPGCLNYAVILSVDARRELESITGTNRYVLSRNASALESLIGSRPEIRGHTDLAVGPLKFSGNSQRRRRHFTLMHGTLLLAFDLGIVGECLPMPSLQPDYRKNRAHGDFLMNLKLSPVDVKNALRFGWNSPRETREYPADRVKNLVESVYATPGWNRKF